MNTSAVELICVWCKRPCGSSVWYDTGSMLPHCSEKCLDAIKEPEDLVKPEPTDLERVKTLLQRLKIQSMRTTNEIGRVLESIGD